MYSTINIFCNQHHPGMQSHWLCVLCRSVCAVQCCLITFSCPLTVSLPSDHARSLIQMSIFLSSSPSPLFFLPLLFLFLLPFFLPLPNLPFLSRSSPKSSSVRPTPQHNTNTRVNCFVLSLRLASALLCTQMATHLQEWLHQQPDFRDPSSSTSRLPSLYSDLAAHKSTNHASFESSVAWWKKTLFRACLAGAQSTSSSKGKQPQTCDRLVLHVSQDLLDACTLDSVGQPLGLGSVVVRIPLPGAVPLLITFLRENSGTSNIWST